MRARVRDEGRTEDLVQEIFFSAHNGLATLSDRRAFRSLALPDRAQRVPRRGAAPQPHRRADPRLGRVPPPDERIVVHHPGPDDQLWQKEELAELAEAIDELPQSQHDALVMRELEGRSYEEIGRRMSLSPAAVESVLFRARRGVKRAFDRAAAFLPFPALFGRRGESGEQASGASSFAAQAQGTAAQLTAVGGDHAASVVQKAAAVVAAVAVIGGGTAALEQAGVKVPIVHSITSKKDGDSKAAGTAGPGAASFGGAGGAGQDRAGGPGGSGPPGGANDPMVPGGGWADPHLRSRLPCRRRRRLAVVLARLKPRLPARLRPATRPPRRRFPEAAAPTGRRAINPPAARWTTAAAQAAAVPPIRQREGRVRPTRSRSPRRRASPYLPNYRRESSISWKAESARSTTFRRA